MTYLRIVAACCGWALLAYIGFATLSPIEQRPHMGGVFFERAAAFGLMGFLLASAYHRQGARWFAFVAGIAVVLELAQLFVSGRHAEIFDAVEKMAGGVLGVAAALLITRALKVRSGSR